jgi:cobalt/nickel transport system permease protein
MHIPDGYLGPETVAAGWVVCAPAWYAAGRKTRQLLTQPKAAPMLAAGAAFSFLVMMLNLPVFGGTTAHAVGATLVAVLAGPWVAVLAVTAALVIQAFVFADGGILALGINCLNMAVVMPLVGFGVYRLIAGDADLRSRRTLVAAGAGAYVAIVVAALLVGVELGLQPMLHTVRGVPQYAPYGLGIALPAMLVSHLLVAGPVEAGFTVGVVAFLARTQPQLFASRRAGAALRLGWLYAGLGALALLAPLGLLAGGTAWGEWSGPELQRRLGYVPHGVQRLGGLWKGLLPDYALPAGAGGVLAVIVYIVCALIGVALLTACAFLAVRTRRRRTSRAD